MSRNPFLRRLVTVPALYLLFLAVTALLPLLLVLAVLADSLRWAISRTPWIGTRLVLFLWVYLLGEAWALPALAFVGLLPDRRALAATYALQSTWVKWNLRAVVTFFDLSLEVEGDENLTPGPILVLSRHASLIDTLIPGFYISSAHGMRLRYVLKRELLVDPALDIAGSRLPNVFIDRGAASLEADSHALADLARDLAPDEGLLIYPEGTRFSEQKRIAYVQRYERRGGQLGKIASGYRNVLPPRPSGTVALVEASQADVIVLAHTGLEGFAHVADMWGGGLIGSEIQVGFWRVPSETIPTGRAERVEWLFAVWSQVDAWIDQKRGTRLSREV
ncbi:MAG: lysophospholipid acyltransferase family protein [Acidimicrobiia bacterium]|nr:lysophospholipid acyltransferase family protein [Acidimicrobiia bacterium]MDH3462020.1 lysophospholipid acyltransferase family protein [Acidimicrobiia bacterium]